MPCRDYDSDNVKYDYDQLKRRLDLTARVACKALNELTEQGRAEFLLLKDEEVRKWWAAHQEADRKKRERLAREEAAKRRKEEDKRKRKELIERMTPEERRILGLGNPK